MCLTPNKPRSWWKTWNIFNRYTGFSAKFELQNSKVICQVMLCGKTIDSKQIWRIFVWFNTVLKTIWGCGANPLRLKKFLNILIKITHFYAKIRKFRGRDGPGAPSPPGYATEATILTENKKHQNFLLLLWREYSLTLSSIYYFTINVNIKSCHQKRLFLWL